MNILDEGELDKSLEVPEKAYTGKYQEEFFEVIDNKCF